MSSVPMQMPASTGQYWYDSDNSRTRFDQNDGQNPTVYDLKLFSEQREYAFYTEDGAMHCKACMLTDTFYPLVVPPSSSYTGAGASVADGTTQRCASAGLDPSTSPGCLDPLPLPLQLIGGRRIVIRLRRDQHDEPCRHDADGRV